MLELKGTDKHFLIDDTNNLITSGRFGKTYHGNDSAGLKYIVKEYAPLKNEHPFELNRFKQQTIITGQIYPQFFSENILYNDRYYFIRTFIEGNPVGVMANKKHAAKNIPVLIAIINELKKLHETGWLHTDVKPSNFIAREKPNEIFICDVGSCIEPGIQLPADYKMPFTFIYAPPETILNRYDLCNFSSDIYMFGMLAYHLLTGIPPFRHPNPAMLIHFQLNTKPDYALVKDKKWKIIIEKATCSEKFPKPPHFYSRQQLTDLIIRGQEKRFSKLNEIIDLL